MEFALTMIGIGVVSFLSYSVIEYVVIAIYLIWSVCLTGVFKKIGEDPWKAYIPIYNIYIMIKAAELDNLYILGCLIPLLGKLGFITFYVYIIYVSVMVAKKFNNNKKFLMRVVQVPPFYMVQMAKYSSSYKGKYKKKKKSNIKRK